MQRRVGALAWIVAFCSWSLACAPMEPASPPPAPPTEPAPKPVAAASDAEPAEPVAPPADLLVWMRLAAPARDLPVVGMLVPTDPRVGAVLAQPGLGMVVFAGDVLGKLVDLGQPADVVGTIPDVANPNGSRFAFAVGLAAGTEPAALRGTFQLVDKPGRIGLEPEQEHRTGLIGKAFVCDLWPARSGVAARLVCASDPALLGAYGPFLARGAAHSGSGAAMSVWMPSAGLRAAAAQGGQTAHRTSASEAEAAGERLGRDSVTQYFHDLTSLGAEIDLQRGKIDVALEETFEHTTSAGTSMQCANAGAPAALPDVFWRLPADADAAFFLQGVPPEVMRPLGARVIQAFMDAIPDTSVRERSDLSSAARAIFFTGGPAVVAYGHDRAAAQTSLEALSGAMQKGKAKVPDKELIAGHAAATGWTLVHLDEPSARWRDGLRELLRVLDHHYPADAARPGPVSPGAAPPPNEAAPPPKKKDEASRTQQTSREVPVRPGEGLPKESAHFIVASRPNPHYTPHGDGAPAVPSETHVFVVPDGEGTWISFAEDERTARARLVQALSRPRGRVAARSRRSHVAAWPSGRGGRLRHARRPRVADPRGRLARSSARRARDAGPRRHTSPKGRVRRPRRVDAPPRRRPAATPAPAPATPGSRPCSAPTRWETLCGGSPTREGTPHRETSVHPCLRPRRARSSACAGPAPVAAPAAAPPPVVEERRPPPPSVSSSQPITSPLEAYEHACELGAARGCNDLGVAYLDGKGVTQDVGKARATLEKACELGSFMGCHNLGYMLEHGRGAAPDVSGAAELYDKACTGSVLLACNALGNILYARAVASGSKKRGDDWSRALSLFDRACAGGVAASCTNQGWLLADGDTGDQNLTRAARLYERGCDGGSGLGCVLLGNLLLAGRAGTKDPPRALAYYERSCELDAKSCRALAHALSGVDGIEADRPRARRMLDKACKAGNGDACADLGALLEAD